MNWPQIFPEAPGSGGWDNPIAKYYGVDSIPYAFLLDDQGKIRAKGLRGEMELQTAIESLQQ
jgi:hypothetical protein